MRRNWLVIFFLKIFLSRIKLPYSFWKFLNLFSHGSMEQPDYAYKIFKLHLKFFKNKKKNFIFLELGPGDSITTGIIASYFGAKRSYLVDNGSFATKKISIYTDTIKFMNNFFPPKRFNDLNDFDSLLKRFNIIYLNDGYASLKKIRSNSIDFISSQAVLEHIFIDEIDHVFTELKRIMRPGSTSSHVVDLKDHLAYSLNNLRFSSNFWNSKLIKNSGFYTNRLRLSDYIHICNTKNLDVSLQNIKRWINFPIKISNMHPEFLRYKKDELLIKEVRLIVSKK